MSKSLPETEMDMRGENNVGLHTWALIQEHPDTTQLIVLAFRRGNGVDAQRQGSNMFFEKVKGLGWHPDIVWQRSDLYRPELTHRYAELLLGEIREADAVEEGQFSTTFSMAARCSKEIQAAMDKSEKDG